MFHNMQTAFEDCDAVEQRAQDELIHLFRDAVKVGGAALEMRVRRFASLVRTSDAGLAQAITPLVTGDGQSVRRAHASGSSPVDSDTKLPLVRFDAPETIRQQPLLTPSVQTAVDQVVRERRAAEKLQAAGLMPARSVLMSGPPGVGKTMTAGWLAHELGLPLLTLDLASVMSSYLGKTGANVRAVLTHAQAQPCVLLLDEFDSIAKRRDDDSDVGELKRLVTVILQTIDDWSPASLLVAATNHGELLDPAVWRRFDVTLSFVMPEAAQRSALLQSRGITPLLADALAGATDGQTFSSLARAIESARKQNILEGIAVDESLAAWALSLHTSSSRRSERDRRNLQILVLHCREKSAREIADELGTSHTTVLRALRQFTGEDNAGT